MSAPLFWPGHGAIMGAICAELVESDGNPEDEAYNRGISDACDAACRQMNELLAAAPETATPSLPLQEPVATNWPFVPERPAEVDQSDGYAVLERMKQWAIGMSFYRAENGYDEPLPRTATIRDVKKEAAYLLPRMERFYASVDLLLRERDQAQALAAPSLPAVLTDATCRDALHVADQMLDVIYQRILLDDRMPTFGFNEARRKVKAALATSATPVLP